MDGCLSHRTDLVYCVPGGHVLSQVPFLLYTRSLLLLSETHAVKSQNLSDDMPLFTHTHSSIDATIQSLLECIGEVKSWITFSKLKLNDDKIETFHFGTDKSHNNLFLMISLDPTCGRKSEAPSLLLFMGLPGRPSQLSGPLDFFR